MEKKKKFTENTIPSKLKNINLDRQFFNLNTRGSYNEKNINTLNLLNYPLF